MCSLRYSGAPLAVMGRRYPGLEAQVRENELQCSYECVRQTPLFQVKTMQIHCSAGRTESENKEVENQNLKLELETRGNVATSLAPLMAGKRCEPKPRVRQRTRKWRSWFKVQVWATFTLVTNLWAAHIDDKSLFHAISCKKKGNSTLKVLAFQVNYPTDPLCIYEEESEATNALCRTNKQPEQLGEKLVWHLGGGRVNQETSLSLQLWGEPSITVSTHTLTHTHTQASKIVVIIFY